MAENTDYQVEEIENGFLLEMSRGRGGRIVYEATITYDEANGTMFVGKVKEDRFPKKESNNPFVKFLKWLGLNLFKIITFIPMTIYLVGMCIYMLYAASMGKNFDEPLEEKLLFDFMLQKMSCTKQNSEQDAPTSKRSTHERI